jgi:hypothetical protein
VEILLQYPHSGHWANAKKAIEIPKATNCKYIWHVGWIQCLNPRYIYKFCFKLLLEPNEAKSAIPPGMEYHNRLPLAEGL